MTQAQTQVKQMERPFEKEYAEMYPVDFYGKARSVSYDALNKCFELVVSDKKSNKRKLKISKTDLGLMVWRFYEDIWTPIDPSKSGSKNYLNLPSKQIVEMVNKQFEQSLPELRYIANEERFIKVVASKRYVPVLPEELVAKTVEILKKNDAHSDSDNTIRGPDRIHVVPMSCEITPEAQQITQGQQPYLILDTGDNFYSRSIYVKFGVQVQVCQNGLVAAQFFGEKARIHRYGSVAGYDDFEKRKVFFKRFEKQLGNLVNTIKKNKEKFDDAIVSASKHKISIVEQKRFIDNSQLATYIKEEVIAKIEKDKDETRWGLSQAITWVASHVKLRSDNTAYNMEVLGGKILYETKYVQKQIKGEEAK